MPNLKAYNERYRSYSIYKRIEELYIDFDANDIMLTSAFSAYSAILLKVISEVNPKQIIYFIDTGFHFQETLGYKKQLTALYQLNIITLSASYEKQTMCEQDKLWLHKPNDCCHINRVEPLEKIKNKHKVWVNGVMNWQTAHRNRLSLFEQKPNIIKFHPLLDMDAVARDEFIQSNSLPAHPLFAKGYESIGCTHCTKAGDNPSGRWEGLEKTECGLHL